MIGNQHTLVVGAGVAGMTCARKLAASIPGSSENSLGGTKVTVLDKGRRPGGRLATRVSRSGPIFDQGAQFLTARSVTFQQQVAEWCDAGVAALWDRWVVDLKPGREPKDTARKADRYVGTPKMASVVEHLCDTAGFEDRIDGPHFGVRVTELKQEGSEADSGGDSGGGWVATDEDGKHHGPFGRVVLALPASQARELLAGPSPALAERLSEVETAPTWTVMLAFAETLGLNQLFSGAFVENSALGILANQTSKPGRPGADEHGECWTLHAALDWSQQHVDDKPEQVTAALTAAFGELVGPLRKTTLPVPTYAAAHRWLYGHIVTPLSDRWLFDDAAGLGYCGDACTVGSPANIERAWLSGLGLGEHLAASN